MTTYNIYLESIPHDVTVLVERVFMPDDDTLGVVIL